MQATAQHFEAAPADRPTAISRREAEQEDAYWSRTFWQERYFDPSFDYEDYAPAYCVGYAGCAQYGGAFADAQRCLCANWERIKGDSRLSLDQALPAIRAAWERTARLRQRRLQPAMNDASFAAGASRRALAVETADAAQAVAA
ncbi:hypothetical protein [Ramlibacter sp.]|uniref:hypothetical protein n=1 Tax=Ramlibacter sp. TaxID=1917967 RepID=UPI002C557B61|nr:hypothetical protein [Ramlibacter sp.]HWI82019.1 hypothetical protein [Ramlibacter sp.]